MKRFAQILREPLVHFALAGALVYGAYLFVTDEVSERGQEAVVVDRDALLRFMQYRANAFEPETFNAVLDSMTDAELDEIIAAYVNEEILYREAESLHLESSDYIIRQRMVQKMSFLIADLADSGSSGGDSALRQYFEAHRDAYAIQPWTTFTHVFFDAERRGEHAAAEAARTLLDELNAAGVGFNDAAAYGDRFPFLRNYVERTYEYVASHFGYEFAEALAALPASENQWQGPLRSALGRHLVLVTRQAPRTLPAFEDVRADVERDFAEESRKQAVAQMTESMRERYRIELHDIREPAP